MTAPRRLLLLVIAFVVLSTLAAYLYITPQHLSGLYGFSTSSFAPSPAGSISPSLDLGFISKTYVISLPHRSDRRKDIQRLMERLRVSNWAYVDGTYANTSLIQDYLHHVQAQRSEHEDYSLHDTIYLPFSWPADASNNSLEYPSLGESIPLAGAELWPFRSPPDVKLPDTPMVCAEDDFRLTKYSQEMQQWRFLTPERVATFHSHLTAVRRVVDDNARAGVTLTREEGKKLDNIALILEDDVDMEVDIKDRMKVLLPMLPYDWDMLYLGFCWSTENKHPVLEDPYLIPQKNQLYPSFQPRCLTAYALSPAGAVRLLSHLRHEPFAYGRSVDLATEWLVWTKRVKSFTVVPPVVIQRKVTKTDITLVGGALWKESLEEGALGTKQSGDEV
jgi:GR25 family glycosyltransferase involved in LPS biosynthesis